MHLYTSRPHTAVCGAPYVGCSVADVHTHVWDNIKLGGAIHPTAYWYCVTARLRRTGAS